MHWKNTPLLFLIGSVAAVFPLVAAPPSEDYTLALSDEFYGDSLDTELWYPRDGERKRFHSFDLAENIRVENGRVHIDFQKRLIDGNEEYTGGGMYTNNYLGYGYYEVKGKLFGAGPGLHSSFWSMGLNGGDGKTKPKYNKILEIDGYEVNSHSPSDIALNVHYNIGRQYSLGGFQGTAYSHDVNTSKEDFVLGFEWLPDQINWYLNGKLIRRVENPSFYGPQNLWLTALASPKGFGGGPKVKDSALPGESSWDYFRYYHKPLPGVNLLANGSFDYNLGKDFEPKFRYSPHFPVAWLVDGDSGAVQVTATREALDGECLLRFAGTSAYQVTLSQNLEYIPNGTYRLSAWVRSSGGQDVAEFVVSGFGGEDKSIAVPGSIDERWHELVIEDIPVANQTCSVSIVTKAQSGQWLEVDKMTLAMEAEPLELLEKPVVGDNHAQHYLGEIVIDDHDAGKGFEEKGSWHESSLSGYQGHSRYTGDVDASATWRPKIVMAQEYRILFHNIAYKNNTKSVEVTIETDEGSYTRLVPHNGGGREWVDIGTYYLPQGSGSTVTMRYPSDTRTSGYMRTDSVRFIPIGPANLSEAVVMMVGNNYVIINMQEEKIDPVNPGLVPQYGDGGKLYVPMAYTVETLSDFTGYKAEIKAGSKGLLDWFEELFEEGDSLDMNLCVQGKLQSLDDPVMDVKGERYLSAADAAKCFELQLLLDKVNGILIFSDEENILGDPPDELLVQEVRALFPAK